MSFLQQIYDTFWADKYWYPPSLSWQKVEEARNAGVNLARPRDLLYTFYWMIVVFIFRMLFEKFIGMPVAIYVLGDKKRRMPENCPELEKLYQRGLKSSKNLKSRPIKSTDSDSGKEESEYTPEGWTPARVNTWYKRRRAMNKQTKTKKFSETLYRFCMYLFLWTWGIYTLYDKPWVYDTFECWKDFPFQNLDYDVYLYYVIELAFYGTLILQVGTDTKRKDFTEQIIHHFTTIMLVSFSYMANFIRIGTLVLIIHDTSDIFLEAAKLFVYAKKQNIADPLFTVFAVVFIVSRDFIYPYMVLHTTWVKSMWLYEPFFGYYAFNGFLSIVMILNLFWTFTILRMAYLMSKAGTVQKDGRSDTEESSSEESDKKNK